MDDPADREEYEPVHAESSEAEPDDDEYDQEYVPGSEDEDEEGAEEAEPPPNQDAESGHGGPTSAENSLSSDEGEGSGDSESLPEEPEAAADGPAGPAPAAFLTEGRARPAKRASVGRAPRRSPAATRADPHAAHAVEARFRRIVAPENRLTASRLTLAEATRAVAIRAAQIAAHPTPYVEIGVLTDPREIALKELYEARSPLLLYRDVGRTSAGEVITEVWKVREMGYPQLE